MNGKVFNIQGIPKALHKHLVITAETLQPAIRLVSTNQVLYKTLNFTLQEVIQIFSLFNNFYHVLKETSLFLSLIGL